MFASELEWKADFRYRLETNKSDSLYEAKSSTVNLLRSRIALKFTNGPVTGFAQLQDSRYLGDWYNKPGLSSQYLLYNTFYFHQLYFQVDHILKRNWSVRIGRFEMALGSERFFSLNDWNNYGKSFEGFQSTTRTWFGELRLFNLMMNEKFYDPKNDVRDDKIYGIFFNSDFNVTENIKFPVLEMYNYADIFELTGNGSYEQLSNDRNTIGFRTLFQIFMLSVEWEIAMQNGKVLQDSTIGHVDLDALYHVVNVHLLTDFLPFVEKISFGQEFISGDDMETEKLEGFANPWGAGHIYHGYFDRHTLFINNNQAGLEEWNVKTLLNLPGNFKLNVHYHNFKNGISAAPLGTELDVVFSRKLGFGGVFQQGFSRYWENGGDQLDYSWLMLTFTL